MLLHGLSSSPLGRVILFAIMAVATLLTLTAFLGFGNPAAALRRPSDNLYSHPSSNNHSSSLAQLALSKVLDDASPVFGDYVDVQSNTSTWYALLTC